MSKLIPTPIVDKNGKPTTVHKKVSAAPVSDKLGAIAPTLGGASAKPSKASFKPTYEQNKVESHGYQTYPSRIDPGLYPFLSHGEQTRALNIRASDVELYEALAAVKDTSNALACFEANKGVPDEEFLERNGLTHLANTDPARSELIKGALERRIPADDFAKFDMTYSAYSDMPAYLDAAQAHSIATLRKMPDFVHEIRRGDILLSDVMAVGVKAVGQLNRSASTEGTIKMFRSLKNGTANFTVSDLKTIYGNKNTNRDNGLVALTLMRKHGGEFVAGIKDLDLARDITFLCDRDEEKNYAPAITYADQFRMQQFRNHKQVYELFRAGVDLEFAINHSRRVDEMTVQQIIALHQGISSPITSGWL